MSKKALLLITILIILTAITTYVYANGMHYTGNIEFVIGRTDQTIVNGKVYSWTFVSNWFQPQKLTADSRLWGHINGVFQCYDAAKDKCTATFPNYCYTTPQTNYVRIPPPGQEPDSAAYIVTRHTYKVKDCPLCTAPKQRFYSALHYDWMADEGYFEGQWMVPNNCPYSPHEQAIVED